MTAPVSWLTLLTVAVVACGGDRESVVAARPHYIPEFYTSERIDATVVDADSGQPVAGAIVVAIWRQVDARVESWAPSLFGVSEVETGTDGRFTIHRWGPRMASPEAFIDKRSPELWVLKEGYRVGFFDNTGDQRPSVPLETPDDGASVSVVYVTLPPNKMAGRKLGAYARPADASSLWNGRQLALQRPESPRELASSLAGANPFERDLSRKLSPLPGYWEEWHRSRDTLPQDLRTAVSFPPSSLVDYSIRSDRSDQ